MPRHVSPTDPQRTATAPYNFVPLPERVFTVAEGIAVGGKKIKPWEMHDQFVPGTHSGFINLEITTLTPLYIRGAVMRSADGAWDHRDSRLRSEPYTMPDGRPAIPGSSLRGMVRTLVEILAFGKIQPVSEARPFFRDISPSRISTEYRRQFIEDLGVLETGMDIKTGQPVSVRAPGYCSRVRAGLVDATRRIIRESDCARVDQQLLSKQLSRNHSVGSGPGATPNWQIQHSTVWAQVDPRPQAYFFARQTNPHGRQRHPDLYLKFRKVEALSSSKQPGYQQAILVITGGVPYKHLEFVFLDPTDGSRSLTVPRHIWDRFHDEDQITQWQEKAFPRNQPQGRRAAGHLCDGEPVFFLVDESKRSDDNPDGLVFLGRAGMFRFPYDQSPRDLVPDELRNAPLDLAEVMFGKVGRNEIIKGRVFFEDAVATNGGPDWFEETLVPRILSAPKPTTFQHYLTQDGTKGKDALTTYLADEHTAIRGHKLYWHRWEQNGAVSQVKEANNHDSLVQDLQGASPQDTQHTVIRPVKPRVTFSERIRFENLTELELGALLEALCLPEGCHHRMGMGKALGLGSVRITALLQLVDRAGRYRSWRASGIDDGNTGENFRNVFVTKMLDHAHQTNETLLNGQSGLRQIARLDALCRLLSWSTRPEPPATEHMDLRRFKDRPVLPTPHGVADAAEPPWPSEPPRPAGGGGGGSGSGQHRDPTGGARRSNPPRGLGPATSRSAARPVPKNSASAVRGPKHAPGEKITVTRVEDHKGKPKFQASDGLLGHFANENPPPVGIGETAEVWVANVNPQAYTLTLRQPKGKKR